MCAHSLLASADYERGHQPLIQRNVTAFEKGSDRDRKLLAARIALVPADAGGDRGRCFKHSAMRANGTVWPKLRFEPFAGFGFVLKCRVVEFVQHEPHPGLVEVFYIRKAAESRL